MLLRKTNIIVTVMLASVFAFMLSACSDSESDDAINTVSMPVILAIPASDGEPTTRAGDPGSYEQFKFPRYAYIYIVCKDDKGNDEVVRSTPVLDESKWTKMRYTGGLANSGDSIYQYNGDVHIYLPTNRQATGRVYAALSTVPLHGLPTGNESYDTSGETGSTVRRYKYQVTKEVVEELANIYSTPYNYRPDGTNYYGTMNDLNSLTPSLNIVLYHVAGKLDVLWNVDEQIQKSTALKSLTLTVPAADSAYIFRPLETNPTKTIDETINISVGNQWYGRDYKYVLPLSGDNSTYTFTATMGMTDGSTRSRSIDAGVIIKTRPFAPWMRGTISVQ